MSCFFLSSVSTKSQILSLADVIRFPVHGADTTDQVLKSRGWESYNIELIADSDLVRKTWVINNKYNNLKSYVQFWEFNRRIEDNHISYQFSDRKAFDQFHDELKKLGYKEFNPRGKKKKKKKGDPNIYKETDEPFINEKNNSLIVLKQVFLYGMNAYMLYSYNATSKTAQFLIGQEKDK